MEKKSKLSLLIIQNTIKIIKFMENISMIMTNFPQYKQLLYSFV